MLRDARPQNAVALVAVSRNITIQFPFFLHLWRQDPTFNQTAVKQKISTHHSTALSMVKRSEIFISSLSIPPWLRDFLRARPRLLLGRGWESPQNWRFVKKRRGYPSAPSSVHWALNGAIPCLDSKTTETSLKDMGVNINSAAA